MIDGLRHSFLSILTAFMPALRTGLSLLQTTADNHDQPQSSNRRRDIQPRIVFLITGKAKFRWLGLHATVVTRP